jgi:hypothetical protein
MLRLINLEIFVTYLLALYSLPNVSLLVETNSVKLQVSFSVRS